MSTQPPPNPNPNPYGAPPQQFNQEPSFNQQMASYPPPSYPSYPSYPAQYGPRADGQMVGQSNSPTIALVCGILAFVGAGLFTAIPAVIYGIKGRRETLEGRTPNRGMATAGMWLGIANLAVAAIVAVCFLAAFIMMGAAGVAATPQPGL